jgi:pSer/pThr/pTyr-binding forkhead associated (FHA) protein
MHVKLKVLRGASAGKEVAITGPRFFIGRSEECHLRANSDAISRRHCAITVDDGEVQIRDLGSRNGTYVNGVRIDGAHGVQMGDQLRIGPLEFLVTFVKSTKAAGKPSATDSSLLSDDEMAGLVDDWLNEGNEKDRRLPQGSGETREFRMDETNRFEVPGKPNGEPERSPGAKPEKPTERPPVLPTRGRSAPKNVPKDTQEAAAQALRKFFNRGG